VVRRRDRRGRGLRGPLAPPQVPIAATRAETFDDLVGDAIVLARQRLGAAGVARPLQSVRIRVDEVPPEGADLAAARAGDGANPAELTVFRRPIEARSAPGRDRARLIREVVLEQAANLYGLPPEALTDSD
jgi:hypothetical protein